MECINGGRITSVASTEIILGVLPSAIRATATDWTAVGVFVEGEAYRIATYIDRLSPPSVGNDSVGPVHWTPRVWVKAQFALRRLRCEVVGGPCDASTLTPRSANVFCL